MKILLIIPLVLIWFLALRGAIKRKEEYRKYYNKYKILSPTIILILALVYMFTIGNNVSDKVIWDSLEAHAAGLTQEQRVEKLLTEPTIEDYSTSLPDYYEFGEKLKEEIKDSDPWIIYDIDRLAKAVARHETGNCTLGYGKSYNNCFGIKNGNTAPCKRTGRNRMCIYDRPEESYEAFKVVWSTWYNGMPTWTTADRWTGGDRTNEWLRNVNKFYQQI